MSETTLRSLFNGLQEQMAAKLALSRRVEHPVDKGDNSEIAWRDWFTTYFPRRYKADKATIIDCDGHTSQQIDLVLYDAQYSYLAFNENNVKYLPAESVYAVFEVKQCANKKYLEYAGEKIASVRKLRRTSTSIPFAAGIYAPKQPIHIIGGFLSTDSDWSPPLGKFFKDCIETINQYEDRAIDFGCILNGGSFVCHEDGIQISNANESLINFFLKLLIALQQLGTVPAIDLKEYAKVIENKTL